MSIRRCIVHDLIRKLRSFSTSRIKRVTNAFPYIVTLFPPLTRRLSDGSVLVAARRGQTPALADGRCRPARAGLVKPELMSVKAKIRNILLK